MVESNGAFACSRGVNEDGDEKGGVLVGHKRQNQTKIESLSPNIDVENGECDVFLCHEAANRRIKLTPKENDQEVVMAEILLNLKPIGLKLYNLPDLINTMEKHLNYTNHQAGITHHPNFHAKVDDHNSPQQMTEKEKLKASNFAATLLKIGSWERVTRNEGDLVAKCYYAKKKLVWEFLERGLKSKIEIQWSDILAMRADIQENKPGILEIELSKPPTFHDETDPQPRKHTIWRLTTDFTGGEASKWRRHYLRFPPGSLDKHYEKLLQCDSRLLEVSQQRFPSLKSPIFESNSCGFQGFSLDFNGRGVLHMNHPRMHWPVPRIPQQDFVQNQLHYQSFMKPTPLSFHETPSPISVMDLSHSDEVGGGNKVFENSRMALWGGNGAYQGLPSTTYRHLHRRRPDQTFAMDGVQGIESIVSSTTPLDRNFPFRQNHNLVPYDQAMESSQLELLGEMRDQLLSDRSQVGVFDNNYHLARVASLNALVDLAKEQKGNSRSESYQTLYGVQDLFVEENLDLSIEDVSDQLGSGFDQFCDQQQQIVPCNVPTQVSSEDTMIHDNQLPWTNSAKYPSSVKGYDHHGNPFNGVNHWS